MKEKIEVACKKTTGDVGKLYIDILLGGARFFSLDLASIRYIVMVCGGWDW